MLYPEETDTHSILALFNGVFELLPISDNFTFAPSFFLICKMPEEALCEQ